MSTRKELNLEIIRQLTHYVKMNPEIRLGQALVSTGILESKNSVVSDPFYEEPDKMLERVRKNKKKGLE